MKQIRTIISALALIVMLSAFTINKLDVYSGYKIGDIVNDFELMNVDGKMVSLSDYKDAKGFIIAFTCNTCPYAKMYENRIINLNNEYAPKGFPLIAVMPNNTRVSPEDGFEAMKQRANDKGYTFPYLLDKKQNVYPQFGATKTPHMFVLQKTKKGNVVKYIGAVDDNYKDASLVTEKYVENAVNDLLKGKEVEVKETKAIGCGIKA